MYNRKQENIKKRNKGSEIEIFLRKTNVANKNYIKV